MQYRAGGAVQLSALIVAIDPATVCGYAVGELARKATVLESGSHVLGRHAAGEKYSNLWALLKLLHGRIGSDVVEAVAAEQGFHRGGAPTRFHLGCVAICEMFAHQIGARFLSATVQQIKATAGDGRADKASMVYRARAYFGHEIEDDNEADALWLYEWARGKLWSDAMTAVASRG
jgi:Holliday junction resolvasome RuvABC endonuclease subunit